LKAFSDYTNSWQHKGSSYLFPQDTKPPADASFGTKLWENLKHIDHLPETSGENYPLSGEIDLMKYYNDNVLGGQSKQPNYFKRIVAAEKDVFGLIWLTKIKFK
jgi:hypothetical protein